MVMNAPEAEPDGDAFTMAEVERAVDLFMDKTPVREGRELWAAREAVAYLHRRRKAALKALEEDKVKRAMYAEAERRLREREATCPPEMAFCEAVKYITGLKRLDRALPTYKKFLAFDTERNRRRLDVPRPEGEPDSGFNLEPPEDSEAPKHEKVIWEGNSKLRDSLAKPIPERVKEFLADNMNEVWPGERIQADREHFKKYRENMNLARSSAAGRKGGRKPKSKEKS